MIKLLSLHWEFIRRPSFCLEEYIRQWPLKYAVLIYIFFTVAGNFYQPETFGMKQNMLVHMFGNNDPLIVYAYIIGACLFNLFCVYYLLPPIARWSGSIDKEDFDPNLFRKLVFYSATAWVILAAAIRMPLQVLFSFSVIDTQLGVIGWLLFALQGLVGLYALVPMVAMVAIHWKGLKSYFGLSTLQVIFVQFVVPMIFAIPFFAAGWHKYLEFLKSYIS